MHILSIGFTWNPLLRGLPYLLHLHQVTPFIIGELLVYHANQDGSQFFGENIPTLFIIQMQTAFKWFIYAFISYTAIDPSFKIKSLAPLFHLQPITT